MGKELPWSFAKIRSGEQLNLKGRGFTNVASLTAAGIAAVGPSAIRLAEAEGLTAHADSIRLRTRA